MDNFTKIFACADQLAKAVRRAYEAELNGEVQGEDEDDSSLIYK